MHRSSVDGVHTVRRGESLAAIATSYGTTVGRIKADNGLSSDVIHPGQQLRVGPAAATPSHAGARRYTVRRCPISRRIQSCRWIIPSSCGE